MPFPNLVLRTGGVLHSEATGVPDNGDNEFELAIPEETIIDDWLEIDVFSLGASVSGAVLVSRDGTKITVNFSQSGGDQARVEARLVHSSIR